MAVEPTACAGVLGWVHVSVRCLRCGCAGSQTKFRAVLNADPSAEQRCDALMGLVSELVVPTDATMALNTERLCPSRPPDSGRVHVCS
jgi:hypothetical protein